MFLHEDLIPGTYLGNIDIVSSLCDTIGESIVVNLQVTGEIPYSCLDVYPRYIGCSIDFDEDRLDTFILIEDTCGYAMEWIATYTDLIEISHPSGTGDYHLDVIINNPGISGVWIDTITIIADAEDSPAIVIVELEVREPVSEPCLSVYPSEFEIILETGTTQDTSFSIIDSCSSGCSWSIDESSSIIDILSPLSGFGNTNIDVLLGTESLDIGTYYGNIEVNAIGATGTPANIPVSIEVRGTCIEIDPDTVFFTSCLGDTISTFAINYCSEYFSTFCLETPNDWLTISGDLCGDTTCTKTLVSNCSELSIGTHTGYVILNMPVADEIADTLVVIYDYDESSHVEVSSESLFFEYIETIEPESQPLEITNSGGCDDYFLWTAEITGDFEISSETGVEETIDIFPSSGLIAGEHSGEIYFSDDAIVYVFASINEYIEASLVLSEDSIHFVTEEGVLPSSRYFAIQNTGFGDMDWTIETVGSALWLAYSPIYGTNNDSVNVWVNSSSLGAGVYNSTIRVVAPDADGSPQYIDVWLNINNEGISEQITPRKLQIKLTPNPANDFVLIEVNSHHRTKIIVVDVMGTEVRNFEVSEGISEINWNLSDCKSGIYFVCSPKRVLFEKLVIIR